jgi:hypothetical protein
MATARVGVFAWQAAATPFGSVDATPILGSTHQPQLCRQDDLPEQFTQQLHSSPPQSLPQSRFHQQQLEQTASEREHLEMMHLQQRQQLDYNHYQLQQASPKLASTTAVWWTEDVLELTLTELTSYLATVPGLSADQIARVKHARKKKRHRVYVQRSRQRQRQKTGGRPKKYSQKIDALKILNTAIRSSLKE